jgi:hypothetical protein
MKKRAFLAPLAISLAALIGTPEGVSAKVESTAVSPKLGSQTTISNEAVSRGLVIERAAPTASQFAQHRSHYSHRSHVSHTSHQSHYSSRW